MHILYLCVPCKTVNIVQVNILKAGRMGLVSDCGLLDFHLEEDIYTSRGPIVSDCGLLKISSSGGHIHESWAYSFRVRFT